MPRPRLPLLVAAVAALGGAWTGACVTPQGGGSAGALPPEAPIARTWWRLSPPLRDEQLPPPQVFDTDAWTSRLLCPGDELSTVTFVSRRATRLTYRVECPGGAERSIEVDSAQPAPTPPEGFTLQDPAEQEPYRRALEAYGAGDAAKALAVIDAALSKLPAAPLLRRERIFLLHAADNDVEAMIESEALVRTHPTPLLHKYRVLVAQAIGLDSVALEGLQSIVSLTPETHPLHAEALCAWGLWTRTTDGAEARLRVERGCRLGQSPCCEALAAPNPPPDGKVGTPLRDESPDATSSDSTSPDPKSTGAAPSRR